MFNICKTDKNKKIKNYQQIRTCNVKKAKYLDENTSRSLEEKDRLRDVENIFTLKLITTEDSKKRPVLEVEYNLNYLDILILIF